VVGEHDGRGFVERDGDQAADECRGVGEGVGCYVQDVAGEAGLGGIVEDEGNAVAGVRSYSPVLLVVADEAAVEGVLAAVLVLGDLAGLTVDAERTVLDAGEALLARASTATDLGQLKSSVLSHFQEPIEFCCFQRPSGLTRWRSMLGMLDSGRLML
jgi:hypothetical protein